MDTPSGTHGGLRHGALFHAGRRHYKTAVAGFIRDGLSRREPVLVAVPAGRERMLRDVLGPRVTEVAFVDMAVLGRNPSRIIPFLWQFADRHPAERVRIVAEPAWPGRNADEDREIGRHEALINQAFAGAAAAIVCPYDTRRLATPVLADARRTHPELAGGGSWQPNPNYLGPAVPAAANTPLPAPPATAQVITYGSDLHRVRELVEQHASKAGLSADRTADLVIAVSELAANTLRHSTGGGTVHIWRDSAQILCQVHDDGQLADPLAGHRPFTHHLQDQGLWVVNQLCDLVQIRNGAAGTTIRLQMSLDR